MTRDVNEREFASVLNLSGPKRYEYFVKRAADRDTMWALRDAGGWVTTADNAGRLYLPVWPHARFAAACAEAEWARTEPAPIDVDEWIEGHAEELERDGLGVAVFPTPAGQGVAVSPARLKADLEDEQSNFRL
jgi:hypothetical protein